MKKATHLATLALTMVLIATPVLATTDAPTGRPLQGLIAWVLGMFASPVDVERTAPDVRQRHGSEIIAGGVAIVDPPTEDGGATRHGSDAVTDN